MAYDIQGQRLPGTAQPQIREGRTYIPLREVAEALGGALTWDNNAKRGTVTLGKWTATLTMADTHVDVNGIDVTLQAPPFVDENNTMWVPATFFRDAFGYEVGINGNDIRIALPQAA